MKGLEQGAIVKKSKQKDVLRVICVVLLVGVLSQLLILLDADDLLTKLKLDVYNQGLQQCAQIQQPIYVDAGSSRHNPRAIPGTKPILIKNASLIDGDGTITFRSNVYMEDGIFTRIDSLAVDDLVTSKDLLVYDVQGRFVTPGLVDMHSHAGVDSYPEFWGNEDTNEISNPVTSQMRTIDAIHTDDVMIKRIMSGGITTSLILPGSANLIGGEAFVIKHAEQKSKLVKDYLLQNGITGKRQRWIKMACGENPKRKSVCFLTNNRRIPQADQHENG